MRRFLHEASNWLKGAVTANSPDALPDDASPRARNTAWLKFGYPAKRKGIEILTLTGEVCATPSEIKPSILKLGYAAVDADLNWAIFSNGMWSKQVSGAWDPIDAAVTTPFTAGQKNYVTAIAKGYLFAVNGIDAKKTDGTTIENFGMAAPEAPVVIDNGGAGNPDGTYSIAITRYNSNSGHESSLSVLDAVTVTTNTIRATFPAAAFSGDTQATHIRVHIFKEGLTDRFWQLTAAGVTPNAGAYNTTHGGYPVATSYVVIDITDAQINDLIIQSPSTQENNPPPTGTKFIGWHGSRMFATDGQYLYYSNTDDPESFDPDNRESVDTENGFAIEAFMPLADELLAIIKGKGVYGLIGPDDPNVWEVGDIDTTIGIQGPLTLVATEGALWWLAEQAAYRMKLGEKPERVDMAISDKFENLDVELLVYAQAGYDTLHQRLLFAVPPLGEERNTVLLPFNTKLGIWEDEWDPMDVAALGTWYDLTTEAPFLALGNYRGRAFRLWTSGYVDGVRIVDDIDVALTLTGVVESAGSTSLTDTDANFDTTGDGLAQIPVIVEDATGNIQRNIIVSNTETILTVQASWSVIPDESYHYYIGSPDFQFDTKYFAPSNAEKGGSVFTFRTFKEILVKGISDTGSAVLDVFAIIDHIDNPFSHAVEIALEGSGALFDIDEFDEGVFGTLRAATKHRSLGKRGNVIGLRFVNREPGVGIMLLGVGIKGTEHSHKK